MSKYRVQFKRSVVKDYLSGRGGRSENVARRHGTDKGTVRNWVAAWRVHGNQAYRKKYSHYDARFELKVLRVTRSKSLSGLETAAVFDIRNPASIGVWKRQYDSGGCRHCSLVPEHEL